MSVDMDMVVDVDFIDAIPTDIFRGCIAAVGEFRELSDWDNAQFEVAMLNEGQVNAH